MLSVTHGAIHVVHYWWGLICCVGLLSVIVSVRILYVHMVLVCCLLLVVVLGVCYRWWCYHVCHKWYCFVVC